MPFSNSLGFAHFFCQSFDHDANSYPYYDVSNESYATPNAMIETISEQCKCFVGGMRECGLLHKIDPSLRSLRLEASLYDNYEFFFPLGLISLMMHI